MSEGNPAGGPRGGFGGGGRGRRRPAPQQVEVVAVERLTPRMVSVKVHAADLSRFGDAVPAAHIKIMVPPSGEHEAALPIETEEGRVWPEGVTRPAMRTYTPRWFDKDANTLDIQLVLHGEGPASDWAERAAIGDKVNLGGPGGRFALDITGEKWWIAGDESAIPAIADILERLPATAVAEVHLEVAGPDDELALTAPEGATIVWHHRQAPDAWGVDLIAAARAAAVDAGTQYWAACEALSVRDIRNVLLEAGVARESLITRGYWRRGVADHPDHDFGED